MSEFFRYFKDFIKFLRNAIKSFFVRVWNCIKNFFLKTDAKLTKFFNDNAEKSRAKKAERIRRKEAKKAEKAARKAKAAESKAESANASYFASADNTQEEPNVKNYSTNVKTFHKFKMLFLNTFDIIFEIVFFCGIIFLLNPNLITNKSYFENWNFENIEMFFAISVSEPKDCNFVLFVALTFFVIYFLYKIIFALSSAEGINKIVALLMLLISVFSLFLVNRIFILFLVFYVLLFFAFQLSCGIRTKTARTKFLCLIICNIIAYCVLIFIFSEAGKNLLIALIIFLNKTKDIIKNINWIGKN